MASKAMPAAQFVAGKPELLRQVSRLASASARTRFIAKHRELWTPDAVTWLCDSATAQVKVDPQTAINIAETAVAVASRLGNKRSVGQSYRAKANALYARGHNQGAVSFHAKACKLFARLGDLTELARTLSSSIQPLILLGYYKRALAAAEQARKIFASQGDHWRLARVELNAGNIFHRQDRFAEGLQRYEQAYRYFLQHEDKDPEAVAVSLHNIAMCRVALNDFHGALSAHHQARAFAARHGMQVLIGQADYNIAWLHYLRGEYGLAIDLLRSTRETCRKTDDRYHSALCHLDLSEIYLELNMSEAASEMAQIASVHFQQLGMDYETGRSLVNLAIANSRSGDTAVALRSFARARQMFVREKNALWPFQIDLERAMALYERRRYSEARKLCRSSRQFFSKARIPKRLILSELLLTRLDLQAGKPDIALARCRAVLKRLQKVSLPSLSCQTLCLMAQVHRLAGRKREAYRCLRQGQKVLESLRSTLPREELRISFMGDKLEVYEGLAELCLELDPGPRGKQEAFQYIEQAKSRTLLELMSKDVSSVPAAFASDNEISKKVQDLRAEINSYSHLLEAEQMRTGKGSSKTAEEIRARARESEKQLLRVVREAPADELTSDGFAARQPATLQRIRDSLPAESMIVEYFQVRDRFVAALIGHDQLEIIRVGKVSQAAELMQLLEFQLSKLRLDAEYVHTFSETLLKTAQKHLADLYTELLAPIAGYLNAGHLIVVPHGVLHALPFHAMFDGKEYLIDSFRISYAPSATMYPLCQQRPINSNGPAMVLGIADAAAPLILEEAQAVAAALPGSALLVGENATVEALRKNGPGSRLIHIATHGTFRQDSPMFSAIRLGDMKLSLYDLYHMKLPVELITLSGCGTGLGVVAAGDEFLGLARGLIQAGARSALLTLWDVEDRSTAQFMGSFYRYWKDDGDKTTALQLAMKDLRRNFPHPYYWAPFVLVGCV